MKNLRRTSRRHQAVNSAIWYDFPPGISVMTPEGFWGRVTAAEDGAFAGGEQYLVELNDDMGGGEYDATELTITCSGCGELYSPEEIQSEASAGNHWNAEVDAYHAANDDLSVTASVGQRCAEDYDGIVYQNAIRQLIRAGKASSYADAVEKYDHLLTRAGNSNMVEMSALRALLGTEAALHKTADEDQCPYDASDSMMQGGLYTCEAGHVWSPDDPAALAYHTETSPTFGQIQPLSSLAAAKTADSRVILEMADQQFQGTCPECGQPMWESVPHSHESLQHAASEDYPELSQILVDRPPLAHSTRVASLQTEGGIIDRLLEPVADRMLQRQEESGYGSYNFETQEMASYDWCRFRHNSHCFYPKQLDQAATKQAGYAVWVPEDRGSCPRHKWDEQKACPAPSEPGPKSGDPNYRYETWKSWEQGGQGRYAHLGMPEMPPAIARDVHQTVEDMTKPPPVVDPEAQEYRRDIGEIVTEHREKKNPYMASADGGDGGEFGFHLVATWKDVQAKAKRIRTEGHVRIISASVEYLVGEVQGDRNIYQTSLMREPGTKKVAMWECGCAWAAYSWGRSGRWKKYEGRLCSHALALNYEAQSRGWAGGGVHEDAKAPDWRGDQKVVVPGDYQRGPIGDWRKASLRPKVAGGEFRYARVAQGFSTLDEAASWMTAEAAQHEPPTTSLLQGIARDHHGEMVGLQHRLKTRESLLRKLNLKQVDPKTLTEPFRRIKDALRYTISFPEPDWSNSVQEALWEIQGRGYTIVEEENSWAPGDSYSGLQYNLQAPGSDLLFELQFHTSASSDLKEKVLHKMYEEFRNPSTPLARRQHLWDEMTKHWDNIPIPEHAMDFAGEKYYPRPTASLGGLSDGTARPISTDPDLARPPAYAMVRDMLNDGDTPAEIISTLAALGAADAPGLFTQAMAAQPFKGLVRGMVTEILDLFDDGTVETRQGRVPAHEVIYPTYSPSRGLTASKTAAADLDGYMIAIEIPEDLKTALHAVCTERYDDCEPADNYHLTVVYPGKADTVDAEAFASAANEWALRWGPMTGSISGFGVFHQDGGDKVLYASLNVPGLDRARNDLVDILSAHGIALPDDYGYTPHLTLGYFGEANTPAPPEEVPEITGVEFPINAITLAMGGEWHAIPLTSPALDAAASLTDDAVDLLSFGHDLGLVPETAVRWYSPSAEGQEQAYADMGSTAGIGGAPDATGDTFWTDPPGGTEGCDICGDSGHTTAQHEADPVKYDDATRVAAAESYDDEDDYGKFSFVTRHQLGMKVIECMVNRWPVGRITIDNSGKIINLFVSDSIPEEVDQITEGLMERARVSFPGLVAEMKDEPEAALPTTTADPDDGEPDFVPGDPRLAHLMSGASSKPGAGGDDMKIAEAARAHLVETDPAIRREALKSFSPAEQKQIIDEGADSGVIAANLADLDIAGTHYEPLEAAFAAAEAEVPDEEMFYSMVDIKRDADRDDEVGEGAKAFSLTKPVDPALLDAEIAEKMGWSQPAGVTIEGDVARASTKEPVTVWVLNPEVDAHALQSVVSQHEAPEPTGDVLAEFRERAAAGEDFTADEVQVLLREMVLRA